MVEIYTEKGVSQEDAEMSVSTMAKDPSFFVDVMMKDELGMEPPDPDAPHDHWISGAYCFTSFMICGSVPLIGYVVIMPATDDKDVLFAVSCAMTALMLFILGALKSRLQVYLEFDATSVPTNPDEAAVALRARLSACERISAVAFAVSSSRRCRFCVSILTCRWTV